MHQDRESRRSGRTALSVLSPVKNGLSSIFLKIAALLSSFAVALVLARILQPAGYGIYAYVMTIVTILAIPAQFGLPNLIVRETAKANAIGDWPAVYGLWQWATKVALISIAAIVLIGLISAGVFKSQLDENEVATLAFGFLLLPFLALGSLRGAALRGLGHVILGQLPEMVLRPLFLLIAIAAIWGLADDITLTASSAMGLHALCAALAFLLGAWFLIGRAPRIQNSALPHHSNHKEWGRAALPLALLSSMHLVNQYTDILMVGILGTAEDVGIYRIAMLGGTLVIFGMQAVNMVIGPQFSLLYNNKDYGQLERLYNMSSVFGLVPGLIVTAIIIVWGQEALYTVIGPEFSRGYLALSILAVGQTVNAAMGCTGLLLNMSGNEKKAAKTAPIAISANIVLNLLLIPAYGINGAAIATAISVTIWNILLYRQVRRHLPVRLRLPTIRRR